jgi:hypothetical protein
MKAGRLKPVGVDVDQKGQHAALTRSGKRDRHLTLRTLQPSRVATDEWPGPY